MTEAIAQIQQRGVSVKIWYTRVWQARGISYELDGIAFSGTKLGRAYTFPGLQKYRAVDYQPDRDDLVIRVLIDGGKGRSPLEDTSQTLQVISSSEPQAMAHKLCLENALDKKTHYQQLWQRYSQGVQASKPIEFDDLVAQRAFEDGQTQKAIALMLVSSSPYVAQLNRQQGRIYANQTACTATQQLQPPLRRREQSLEVE
jgi:hypothetical protein